MVNEREYIPIAVQSPLCLDDTFAGEKESEFVEVQLNSETHPERASETEPQAKSTDRQPLLWKILQILQNALQCICIRNCLKREEHDQDIYAEVVREPESADRSPLPRITKHATPSTTQQPLS
jgi:hypothetical protein